MRVIFIGNVWDYSPGFLAALSRRSADRADPIQLQAVVCPIRHSSRLASYWFAAKRDVGLVLGLWPESVGPELLRERLQSYRSGFSRLVQQLARAAGARMLWPGRVSEPQVLEQLQALKADLVIVAGLNEILNDRVIHALPPIFNIHPSLLPEFRGAAPEYWQLDAGLTSGGVTIHKIDVNVDTGPIALQKPLLIEPWLDADALVAKSVRIGTELLHEFLAGYPATAGNGTQPTGGSYQPVPKLTEQSLPLGRSANGVFNRARAVGFQNPLLINVSRREWSSGGTLLCSQVPSEETVSVGLYDAVMFNDYSEGSVGALRRIGQRGVVLTCNPGSVLFRRTLFSRIP